MSTKEGRTEELRKIKDEVINLKESPLYEFRVKNKNLPVIGEGSHNADIMFIGEAPGKNEAATGRPFCGVAGKILDELLESVRIKREDVYITNIVKDRPPANRDPLPEEIALYAPFLSRQIEIIQPRVIATLGRFSMHHILDKFRVGEDGSITKLRGRIFETRASYGDLKIIPLYHPAAAIYDPTKKDVLKKDFLLIKKHAEEF